MVRDPIREPEFDEETPPYLRGEMAVVADPDDTAPDSEEELPVTVREPYTGDPDEEDMQPRED